MVSKLFSHVRHNVVAYLALFVALGGTAYAAKPLLTGADIQDESLTGADILDNAVQGADVLESSLGQVPSAANADSLGGTAASSYLKTGDSAGGDLTGTYPNPTIAGGAIGPAQFNSTIPAVRAGSACRSIPNTDPNTRLSYQGEWYDTAALHSTSTNLSRFTAPVAGVYRISYEVDIDANATGYRTTALVANGSDNLGFDGEPGDAAVNNVLHVSTEYKLAAGDYVEVVVYQNSGGALFGCSAFFTMSWVAPG